MHGYICFYKGKRLEIHADTKLVAQREAAMRFNAKRTFDVAVELAEIDGKPYVHTPTE